MLKFSCSNKPLSSFLQQHLPVGALLRLRCHRQHFPSAALLGAREGIELIKTRSWANSWQGTNFLKYCCLSAWKRSQLVSARRLMELSSGGEGQGHGHAPPWGLGLPSLWQECKDGGSGDIGKGPGGLMLQFGQGGVSVSSSEEWGNKTSWNLRKYNWNRVLLYIGPTKFCSLRGQPTVCFVNPGCSFWKRPGLLILYLKDRKALNHQENDSSNLVA